MWNAWLDEAHAGIKIARRNLNNLRYADDTTLMAESKEELKSLLKKVKEKSEKADLKLNIQKTKIMASDDDCSHEIKRCLLLGRKTMTNLDSILKGRDITLPTKVHLVKAMVFPVVMYGCETWTIKKAEHQGIDAFELWSWRRLLRIPWTARRSNQSILKEINHKYSLEGLMLKLKLQYFGHLMWRTDSLGKTLMLGNTEGRRRRGCQRLRWLEWHHQLDGHEFEQAPGVGDGQGSLACCSPWGHQGSDTTEQLNWTEKEKERASQETLVVKNHWPMQET